LRFKLFAIQYVSFGEEVDWRACFCSLSSNVDIFACCI